MKKSYLTLGILATVLSSKVIMATNDGGLNDPNSGSSRPAVGPHDPQSGSSRPAADPHDNSLPPNIAVLPNDGGWSYFSPAAAAAVAILVACKFLAGPSKSDKSPLPNNKENERNRYEDI